MSTYCTIGGRITYEDFDDFERAATLLRNGGWVQDGYFLDETERKVVRRRCVDEERRTITIPVALHRNLGAALDKLFEGGKGRVVWASTDGKFCAGVIVNGREKTYDLTKWAKRKKIAMPDVETDPQGYCDWQNRVERAFFVEQKEAK